MLLQLISILAALSTAALAGTERACLSVLLTSDRE